MKKTKSKALGAACVGALGLFSAISGLAAATGAQAIEALCPEGGFDICFPTLDTGAPDAACASAAQSTGLDGVASDSATAQDALTITACLDRVCRDATSEPAPGFFEYCCARGGSDQYDDFCVWVVQSSCSGVADLCAERCPRVELLLATVTLAPPPSACFASYPPFIAGVCAKDPFCCATSWDTLCAQEALTASPLAEFYGGAL